MNEDDIMIEDDAIALEDTDDTVAVDARRIFYYSFY
jgi:hypothetical protein